MIWVSFYSYGCFSYEIATTHRNLFGCNNSDGKAVQHFRMDWAVDGRYALLLGLYMLKVPIVSGVLLLVKCIMFIQIYSEYVSTCHLIEHKYKCVVNSTHMPTDIEVGIQRFASFFCILYAAYRFVFNSVFFRSVYVFGYGVLCNVQCIPLCICGNPSNLFGFDFTPNIVIQHCIRLFGSVRFPNFI